MRARVSDCRPALANFGAELSWMVRLGRVATAVSRCVFGMLGRLEDSGRVLTGVDGRGMVF